MGSQQLLLVVVGVVLVGIMIAVGLFLFRDQASATNRDAVSNDLAQFGASAQKYYRRPAVLGGGQSSFAGLTMPKITTRPSNANGSYVLTPSPVPAGTTSVNITGTGTELGDDGTTKVVLTMTVWADSILIVMNN
jgi:hypothetical protein